MNDPTDDRQTQLHVFLVRGRVSGYFWQGSDQ